jgi:CheY-like chemotaxis protein
MESTPTQSNRPLILCIDDDEVVLRIRKLLVGNAGYDVVTASSGEAGLEAFSQQPVDLVVSDHFLSDSSGTDIARRMKELKPHVPILIVSGSAEEPASLQYANGFVSKGEPPSVLLDAMARLLERNG